jgi:putative copper export protein
LGCFLLVKLGLVAAILALSGLHDFWIGPRASRALREGSAQAGRWRAQATWLGRINLLLSLGVLALAVLLVRGGL